MGANGLPPRGGENAPRSPEQANLLAVLTQRYQEDETILWQGPALALAAQAFLLTIALGKDTTSAGRIISTSLALITALSAIFLVLRKRQELDDILSEICKYSEDIANAFHLTHATALKKTSTPEEPRMKEPSRNGVRKILLLRSSELWLLVLCLFGVGDVLIFVLMGTGRLYK
jgi:hypothetical protein